MIKDIILVGIGSGIGGICRYLISLAMNHGVDGFPWGTFTVNVAGCLIIGILWGVTSRMQSISPALLLFLMVGFVEDSLHSQLSQKRAWHYYRPIIIFYSHSIRLEV